MVTVSTHISMQTTHKSMIFANRQHCCSCETRAQTASPSMFGTAPDRQSTCLEQPAAASQVCTFTAGFSESPENTPCVHGFPHHSVSCEVHVQWHSVISDTIIVCFKYLRYLLTYFLSNVSFWQSVCFNQSSYLLNIFICSEAVSSWHFGVLQCYADMLIDHWISK